MDETLQLSGIDGKRLVEGVADELTMADVVRPEHSSRNGSNVCGACEGIRLGVRQARPLAVQPVSDVCFAISEVARSSRLDDCNILIHALQPVDVPGLVDIRLQRDLGVSESIGKVLDGRPQPPELAIVVGVEEIRTLIVADYPVVETAFLAWVPVRAVQHRLQIGRASW